MDEYHAFNLPSRYVVYPQLASAVHNHAIAVFFLSVSRMIYSFEAELGKYQTEYEISVLRTTEGRHDSLSRMS